MVYTNNIKLWLNPHIIATFDIVLRWSPKPNSIKCENPVNLTNRRLRSRISSLFLFAFFM